MVEEYDERVEYEEEEEEEEEPVSNQNYYNTGRWTIAEHDLFLKALRRHGRNWKVIQGLIKSRSATQVRTHAQKFFTRDNYKATKRGRYASRLKDIETPDIMDWLRSSGSLAPKHSVRKKEELTVRDTKSATRPKVPSRVHIKQELPLTVDRATHFIKQESPETAPQVVISMSEPAAAAARDQKPRIVVKDEWSELSKLVEPLEFFADIAGHQPQQREGPEQHDKYDDDDEDCLDWLANQSESPVIQYYGNLPLPSFNAT